VFHIRIIWIELDKNSVSFFNIYIKKLINNMRKLKSYQNFMKESEERIQNNFLNGNIVIDDEVFENLAGINTIGDKQQYSEYLSNIFQNSKVKKILFHGSPNKFDKFEKSGDLDGGFFGKGFYFTDKITLAQEYQKRKGSEGFLYIVIVNLENPYYWKENQINFQMNTFRKNAEVTIDKDLEKGWEKELVSLYNKKYGENISRISDLEYADELNRMSAIGTEFMLSKGYDGSVAINPLSKQLEYAVFDSSKIHILGSKKDIDDFKKYISKKFR